MRHALLCLVLGACAFERSGLDVTASGDGGSDGAVDAAEVDAPDQDAPDAAIDGPLPIDAMDVDAPPPVGRVLVDDSAGDFAQGSPSFDEARVESAGGVAPRAYYVGSLCAAGSDDRLFTDGTTATGAVLPANPTRVGLARGVELDLADNAIPPGVGITSGSEWTLWWTGELFLPAGAHTLALRADDNGFLELRAPGATAFTKLLGVNHLDGERSVSYTAPTSGWYGVRIAVAQANGPVGLYARLDGVAIPRRLTRCRVDQLTGLAQTAFDQSQFLDVVGSAIEQSGAAAFVDWGNGGPGDLGLTSNDSFSVRWAGQFFLNVGGNYRLRIRSDDGYRLWIDGRRVASDTSDGLYDLETEELPLTRGWHDVVFDATEANGAARSQLSVASGPELAGSSFPAARLRPAEGRFERFESMTAPAIAEPGPAMFGFDPSTGAVVTGVDVGYALDVDLGLPRVVTGLQSGATTVGLRDGITGDTVDRFHPIGFDNLTFGGTWGLRFDIQGTGGSLSESWLTVHYRDVVGTGPTPRSATYDSSVRDLLPPGATAVESIDLVGFATRTAAGATVTLAVRTCDVPADCAAAPWSAPMTTGAVPSVTARRYLQYRLAFATDGDHEPSVERVQIDYTTR